MPRCVDGERSLLPLTICPTPQALKEVLKLLADPTVRDYHIFVILHFARAAYLHIFVIL